MKTIIASLLLLITFNVAAYDTAAPKELYWEDLVPEGFEPLPGEVDHSGNMTQVQPNAPVVNAYDGKLVKIPGFVVPLEGTDELVSEFLLVPYFGACIHVPPPPSNQIVYVKFEEGVAIDNIYDAIWVTGTLSTAGWTGEIASVGYRLTGMSVAPF